MAEGAKAPKASPLWMMVMNKHLEELNTRLGRLESQSSGAVYPSQPHGDEMQTHSASQVGGAKTVSSREISTKAALENIASRLYSLNENLGGMINSAYGICEPSSSGGQAPVVPASTYQSLIESIDDFILSITNKVQHIAARL